MDREIRSGKLETIREIGESIAILGLYTLYGIGHRMGQEVKRAFYLVTGTKYSVVEGDEEGPHGMTTSFTRYVKE